MYFQLPYLPEEICVQQADLLQWKVPAGLSLFLKSEKIPALLYAGKRPKYTPFMIFDLFPRPTGLEYRSQITGRACSPIHIFSCGRFASQVEVAEPQVEPAEEHYPT
jgi:hypothetical protein